MSTGMVICSKCLREVHQDLVDHTWYHCEDATPRCDGADSVYPLMGHVKGYWCGRDGNPGGPSYCEYCGALVPDGGSFCDPYCTDLGQR